LDVVADADAEEDVDVVVVDCPPSYGCDAMYAGIADLGAAVPS
jgi:cellulose biosynthesis protein BcsQ